MARHERIIAAAAGLLLLLAFVFVSPPSATVAASAPGVEWDLLLAKLRDGRTCKERRVAALALIATNDKRALEPLRRARERRAGGLNFGGGFALGQSEANACMRKDLDAAIRRLDVQ